MGDTRWTAEQPNRDHFVPFPSFGSFFSRLGHWWIKRMAAATMSSSPFRTAPFVYPNTQLQRNGIWPRTITKCQFLIQKYTFLRSSLCGKSCCTFLDLGPRGHSSFRIMCTVVVLHLSPAIHPFPFVPRRRRRPREEEEEMARDFKHGPRKEEEFPADDDDPQVPTHFFLKKKSWDKGESPLRIGEVNFRRSPEKKCKKSMKEKEIACATPTSSLSSSSQFSPPHPPFPDGSPIIMSSPILLPPLSPSGKRGEEEQRH